MMTSRQSRRGPAPSAWRDAGIRTGLVLLGVLGASAADWPYWRGPGYDGRSLESVAEDHQPRLPPPDWTRNVGEGSGSVVTARGRVYVTGWRDGKETIWGLVAADGSVAWSQSYPAPPYGRHARGDQQFYRGPTATPTLDVGTGLLYTLGCDGDLRCWDTLKHGQPVWTSNLYDAYRSGPRPSTGRAQRDYGYITAPLIRGDDLLVAVGGGAGLVVALDKRTGTLRWGSEAKDITPTSGGISPMTVNGLPCAAVFSPERLVVMRLDPGHEGETLAAHPWKTDYANNLVTPAIAGSRVLISSAYNQKRSVLLDVRPGRVTTVWESEAYTGVCSPVIHRGNVYMNHNRMRCLDLEDGSLVWEGGWFGPDGSCLVTDDDYLLAFGSGNLAIIDTAVRSPDAYREVAAREGICRKGDGWPHVVLSAGRIYCKDRRGNLSAIPLR